MRDFNREGTDHDKRVDHADDKVAIQVKLVVSLKPDDPRLAEANRLLDQMRQSASAAETNRAIFRYDESGR